MKPNFAAWSHGNLAALSEDVTAENAKLLKTNAHLTGENLQLREDLKAALAAWRQELMKGTP